MEEKRLEMTGEHSKVEGGSLRENGREEEGVQTK
jgi:hypothetical protein